MYERTHNPNMQRPYLVRNHRNPESEEGADLSWRVGLFVTLAALFTLYANSMGG